MRPETFVIVSALSLKAGSLAIVWYALSVLYPLVCILLLIKAIVVSFNELLLSIISFKSVAGSRVQFNF